MEKKPLVVHIDNGHASCTPGKRCPYCCSGALPAIEFYEWKSNREIAAILKDILESDGIAVNMITPENDIDVKLTERYRRANLYKKAHPEMTHLFVSIHSDAFGNGSCWNSARGWSAYTTKGQNNSDKFAECLYDEAKKMFLPLGLKIRTDNTDGDSDYEENFTVIKGANMPAVLTENFFYTNVDDVNFLMSDEGKHLIAEVHHKGIVDFYNSVCK